MAKLVYEKAYDWYRCSTCKKIFKRRMVEEDFEQYEFQPKLNFCPNCGSPLKEELVEYMKEMEHAPSYLAGDGSMSGLIRRSDAVKLVGHVCNEIMSDCDCHFDEDTGDEVYDDIKEVDAILKCNKEIKRALTKLQPEDPATGKWIRAHGFSTWPTSSSVWVCSKCGKGLHADGIGSYDQYTAEGQWVACPNCGVTMCGEEQDE